MAKQDDGFEDTQAKNDAWTGMLAISLIALLVGCVFLFLDWNQYPKKDPPPVPKFTPPQAQAPAPAPPAAAPAQPPAAQPPK